jgi:hypothetical protein
MYSRTQIYMDGAFGDYHDCEAHSCQVRGWMIEFNNQHFECKEQSMFVNYVMVGPFVMVLMLCISLNLF